MADDVILRPRPGVTLDPGSGDDALRLKEAEAMSEMLELGATGLKRAGGYLDEEFLPALKGTKGVQVYREMADNSPVVGSLMFTIDRLLRNVDWRVDPAGKDRDAAKAANLVETSMEDMSHTWDDFISEVLSMLPYGWAWHEIVYKRCVGPWETDPRRRSKFTDGMVRWRKLPIRSQDTMLRWVFDESGDVMGMVQMAPPHYQVKTLPISRSLLFRYRQYKNSPEGRSMLRNAYRPWFFQKRLEEFEAIGIERDLAGLPIAKIPADMLKAKPGTDAAKTVDEFRKLVKSVRRNDQEGMVFPAAYDQDTKQALYEFELLASGGARSFDTSAIIQRYEQRILMTVLADFILVGHEGSGSYSMHTDKTGIFRTSLNSITQSIADTINRHAIPRLFMANNWKPSQLPKIVPDDVDAPDITVLGSFMQQMQAMGVQWFPDGDLENFMRSAARLPKLDEDQLEVRRQMQVRSEATQFAQANAEYVLSQHDLVAAIGGGAQAAVGPGGQQQGQQGQQGQESGGGEGDR
jgi:hypothetical protein